MKMEKRTFEQLLYVCPQCGSGHEKLSDAEDCQEKCILEAYSEPIERKTMTIEKELTDKEYEEILTKESFERLQQAAAHPLQQKLVA